MASMKPMDIYVAEIPFEDGTGSKIRPALIIGAIRSQVLVFKITTKCEDKSASVQAHRYKIMDLNTAGLYKQSYVDVATQIDVPFSVLQKSRKTGKLSAIDSVNLAKFVREYRSKHGI